MDGPCDPGIRCVVVPACWRRLIFFWCPASVSACLPCALFCWLSSGFDFNSVSPFACQLVPPSLKISYICLRPLSLSISLPFFRLLSLQNSIIGLTAGIEGRAVILVFLHPSIQSLLSRIVFRPPFSTYSGRSLYNHLFEVLFLQLSPLTITNLSSKPTPSITFINLIDPQANFVVLIDQ